MHLLYRAGAEAKVEGGKKRQKEAARGHAAAVLGAVSGVAMRNCSEDRTKVAEQHSIQTGGQAYFFITHQENLAFSYAVQTSNSSCPRSSV